MMLIIVEVSAAKESFVHRMRAMVLSSHVVPSIPVFSVPNFQLIKENSTLAKLYNNKSVAEQNSVDLVSNKCGAEACMCHYIWNDNRYLTASRNDVIELGIAHGSKLLGLATSDLFQRRRVEAFPSNSR